MTAFTRTDTATPSVTRSNDLSPTLARQTGREGCPTTPDQIRKQQAERAFEAGVRWFLAVSRSA